MKIWIKQNKHRLIDYFIFGFIGAILSTISVTWNDWQLYAILILACITGINNYNKGLNDKRKGGCN